MVGFIRNWMRSAASRRESYKARLQTALAQTTVAFSVDTNILVEFQKLELIPWRDVAQPANTELARKHRGVPGQVRGESFETCSGPRALRAVPHGSLEW